MKGRKSTGLFIVLYRPKSVAQNNQPTGMLSTLVSTDKKDGVLYVKISVLPSKRLVFCLQKIGVLKYDYTVLPF